MAYKIDFAVATSDQLEQALGERLEDIRLSRNIKQQDLAATADISERTLRRLEKGQGVAFETLLRVLIALDLQENLALLLPDPAIRPAEQLRLATGKRQRASGETAADPASGAWEWGDEDDGDQ